MKPMKLEGLHSMFEKNLSPVAVSKRGEPKIPAARDCWWNPIRQFNEDMYLHHQLIGYAFVDSAALIYQDISPSYVHNNAKDLWAGMAEKLNNRNMVATQRAKIRSTKLKGGESIADLAERIHRLGFGLKEFRDEKDSSEGEDNLILAFQEALSYELKQKAAAMGD